MSNKFPGGTEAAGPGTPTLRAPGRGHCFISPPLVPVFYLQMTEPELERLSFYKMLVVKFTHK